MFASESFLSCLSYRRITINVYSESLLLLNDK